MDALINFHIYNYLVELNNNIPRDKIFDHDKINTYMYKTTLLQLTGMLENKVQAIKVKLAEISFEYRYELLKNISYISASVFNIKGILCDIYKYAEVDNATKTIVDELSLTNDSCFKIFNCKKILINTYNIILDIFNLEEEKANYEFAYFILHCNKLFDNNKYNNIFNSAYEKRHSIAHNLESLYANDYFKNFEKNNELYNNIFAQFQSLIYIDDLLIIFYQNLTNNYNF